MSVPKINKEILRLAIPNILSNISVPLLSSVDTALMGQFSELHIGAVGVGAMIFNVIYWNFVFLRMGTTGITAQAYGRKDPSQIVNTLGRAFLVVLIMAGLLLIFQQPIGEAAIYIMNVSSEQYDLVATYFYIRIWAAPASLGLYAIIGWYFGMQNAFIPLLLTIVINVVNIALNFLFIYYFDMDVDGVATSTVIAQYTGLSLGLIIFFAKYGSYLEHLKKAALLEVENLVKFLLINRDIFVRTICMTIAYGTFFSWSSNEGETMLAVNVILLQFVYWVTYAIDGFAFAAESLVGKYVGAQNDQRLKLSIRRTLLWGFGAGALFAAIYLLARHPLISIFTQEQPLVDALLPFFFWVVLFPLVGFISFMWDGIFVGLTASVAMRNSMALALGIFLIVLFTAYPYLGNHGVWMALISFLFARGIIQWAMYWKWGKELR